MTTITIPAIRLDITLVAADADLAASLVRSDATITIDSAIDTPSFFYDIDPSQSPDEAIEVLIFPEGFALSDVDVGGAFTGDEVDAEISLVRTTDSSFTLLNFFRESADLTRITDFFVPLAGDPLPEITNAAEYNAFINSIIEFDIAPLPFSVLGDIPLLSIPSASVAPDLPLIIGTDEADLLEGGDDAEEFNAGRGADTVSAGRGDDSVSGGGGRDQIFGQGGADTLEGGGGKDVVQGGRGKDRIEGGGGRDELFGNGGADRLDGGGGRDQLSGGAGRDMIEGGRGADILTGGGGRDLFVFNTGDGRDTVLDYRDRQDKFMIESGAVRFDDLTILETEGNALIAFSNVRIIVEGVDRADLDASDFLFG